jgi:hypothetical protein
MTLSRHFRTLLQGQAERLSFSADWVSSYVDHALRAVYKTEKRVNMMIIFSGLFQQPFRFFSGIFLKLNMGKKEYIHKQAKGRRKTGSGKVLTWQAT